MPTGTSIAVSTSPAIRSRANQAAWYSLRICSPGNQRFNRFMVSGSSSTSRLFAIVMLVFVLAYMSLASWRMSCNGSRQTATILPGLPESRPDVEDHKNPDRSLLASHDRLHIISLKFRNGNPSHFSIVEALTPAGHSLQPAMHRVPSDPSDSRDG